MEVVCLEDLLPADHRARLAWQVVERLDLSRFHENIAARGGDPGRPTTDPKLLVALWLYATIDNVGSARRLASLCESHDAYRWLCGGVSVNHHTLSDFRVGQGAALDDLLTQVVVALVDRDVVRVDRISQDSRRSPASAGRSSYRRRHALEALSRKVANHVADLKRRALDEDDPRSPRQRAAQERAARERQARIDAALAVLPELEAVKTNQTGKPSKDQPARVSTTDPEARRIKMGNGAVAPAYNVQFATDTASRAIVGVEVVTVGDDFEQSEPVRAQVVSRTGRKVKEHLVDGGYVKKEVIERTAQSGVVIYAPLPKNKHGEPCTHQPHDTPGVTAWRERMQTEEAQRIYAQRASTSETVNAEVTCQRAMATFNVRGLAKVTCVALWSALAYNLIHHGLTLVT
jgi:transposase